tara:strand:+ start:411 stop:2879 length:2469 start_codon:yes stop_codon:yes gene_type:complete
MPAPLIGLPALLQAIATIGVGGAVGYKAKKDLEPLIKELQSSPKDMDSSELKMLRALFMPTQAVASGLKENISEFGLKVPGVIAPDADEMEKVRQDIEKNLKPGETKKVDIPLTTGGSEPPKIDTTETFPAPEEKQPILESFPDQSEKINIPIITYSKDSPKDLKDLVERSVGQEKGEKAIDKLYDDSIFDEILDSDQLARMRQLEENYTGGLNDLGDAGIPVILENSLLDQHEDYMQDYQEALANAARETLGNEFKAYRLMEKDDALRMLTQGEFPNIKRLQEDAEGNEVYKDVIVDMMGQKTPLSREAFSFSLSPKEALSFRYLSAGGRRDRKDEDFVLVEMKASPTDIVMRGHESEKDLVLRVDGNVAGDKIVTPNLFNVYDIKYGAKNQVQLSENKEYKSFVDSSRAETKKPEAPAIVGTMAQEGGKQIKDITAGFSIQKDVVPSLLEQGKAAIPMKNFFEKDTNVVNYKVGDTIGAYGGDVERSLDIEANVKPNFDINSFSEVIKQGAKEYNQDAVFVAESAPLEKANTVGFSLDFGSNLNIADALEVSKRISDTAQIDGFTFKIKNLDTSGASIYLPQEIDLEMTKKVIDKFKPTDQINLAGFIMPDGTMLNFSNNGKVRDTEHRRIGLITHPGSDGISFGPMYDFMNKTGAIRLAGNTNRLYAEISGKPSTTQIRKIADEYNKNRNKYDSLTIALAIPKTEGALQGVKPEEAIDLNKMTYRLPNEAFIEINGTKANANEIYKKFQAADVMGKTFTGIRQLNIPEFSNMSAEEAAQKIVNLGNNMSKVIEETGIKTLDKPESKSYNVKVFKKGKDY